MKTPKSTSSDLPYLQGLVRQQDETYLIWAQTGPNLRDKPVDTQAIDMNLLVTQLRQQYSPTVTIAFDYEVIKVTGLPAGLATNLRQLMQHHFGTLNGDNVDWSC